MSAHLFDEIYEIGGPKFKNYIISMIKQIEQKKHSYNIQPCTDYLLCIDDEKFEFIYKSTPRRRDDYIAQYDGYDYFDYGFAYLSDIILIRKCLKISMITLYNIIYELAYYYTHSRTYGIHKGYVRFDLESCKLLYESGFPIQNLLCIANACMEYESIKYIINVINAVGLVTILRSDLYIYLGIVNILLIDKIMHSNDYALILLGRNLYNLIAVEHYDVRNADEKHMRILAHCYYIIKYNSIEEGLNMMRIQNDNYDNIIDVSDIAPANDINNIKRYKTIHNDLLEFHFRPRGEYTKSARTHF